jgi:short-subunit dehydrogenase
MNPPSQGGTSIKVSADGVKIGWTILATGASIGLGLYIATIVTPIKKDLDTLSLSMAACQKLQGEINNSMIEHKSAALEKLQQLKDEQSKLCDRIKACEHSQLLHKNN